MPTGSLSGAGKKLWESVYNDSLKGSCKGDKKCAAQSAWSAVKNAGWRKNKEGKWVKKSELVEFSMHITKASLDNNVMRWAAVNSDTDYDSYAERMSLELYADFLAYIKGEKELAPEFKALVYSEYWKGGMPYVSISHYPDLNGKAVPGKPNEIFIDGIRLKAKGILFDTPLGHSVYRSLKEDKNKQPEEKIRISIGFLDLAHKHEDSGNLWVRESVYSICPECLQGMGGKVYVQGCLVHLALTRVPVNKRTEMELEEKSMATKAKITRKEDAASIVGKDEAEKIELAQRTSTQRSDVLIEMSETEEETAELIKEAEHGKDTDMMEECMDEDGKIDEECKKRMEAEKDKAEVVEVETPSNEPESPSTEKSQDSVMDTALNETYPVANLPYGGATSMKDAESYVAAKNEAIYLMDMWSVFSNVIWNIMDRPDVMDKRAAMNQAVDEFKNALTAKAMVAFSAVAEKSELSEIHVHELQPAIDVLLDKVDNSIGLGDVEKAQILNPALQEVGMAITDYLSRKSVVQDETPAPDKNNDTLLNDIKELIQPLSEGLKSLSEKVGVLEAKSVAQTVELKPRIPQSRTYQSSVVIKSEAEKAPKPGSVRDIVRKSVGL